MSRIFETSGQIDTMDTSRSQALYQRAKNVIPKGVSGHYGYAVTDTPPVSPAESTW